MAPFRISKDVSSSTMRKLLRTAAGRERRKAISLTDKGQDTRLAHRCSVGDQRQ